MFMVNGFEVDGDAGLVQLLDLAQREVVRSFAEAVDAADDPPAGLAVPGALDGAARGRTPADRPREHRRR